MLDEVISFNKFFGLNFEITAALSIFQLILFIFALIYGFSAPALWVKSKFYKPKV